VKKHAEHDKPDKKAAKAQKAEQHEKIRQAHKAKKAEKHGDRVSHAFISAAEQRAQFAAEEAHHQAEMLGGAEVIRRLRNSLREAGDPGLETVELLELRGGGFRVIETAQGWVFEVPTEPRHTRLCLLQTGASVSDWVHPDHEEFEWHQFTRVQVSAEGWTDHIDGHPYTALRHSAIKLLRDLGVDPKHLLSMPETR
jgi:hypothetical protein